MGDTGDRPDAAACDECGHADLTVRDLGLRIRYALCDPCFDDLRATRDLAGPLPLSRVLNALGDLGDLAAPPGGWSAPEPG